MNNKEYYVIEDLYKKLDIYADDMTGKEIIDLFTQSDLKKYLIPSEDGQELYNNSSLPVYIGDTFARRITMTHLRILSDELMRDGRYGEVLKTGLLHLKENRKFRIDINIDEGENLPNRVNSILKMIRDENRRYYIKDTFINTLEKLKINDLETFNSIISGETYIELNLTVNRKVMDPLAHNGYAGLSMFQALIYSQLYDAMRTFGNNVVVDMEAFGRTEIFFTYVWVRDNVALGENIYNEIIDTGCEGDKQKERVIIRKHLETTLGVKKGKTCLFSVGVFPDVTFPHNINVQDVREDREKMELVDISASNLIKTEKFDRIDHTSLLKGYIVDLTEKYVWIAIEYNASKTISTKVLPIKWEMLVPNIGQYVSGEISNGLRMNTGQIIKSTAKIQGILDLVHSVPILLTEENCLSLKHPVEIMKLENRNVEYIS